MVVPAGAGITLLADRMASRAILLNEHLALVDKSLFRSLRVACSKIQKNNTPEEPRHEHLEQCCVSRSLATNEVDKTLSHDLV